MRREIVFLIGIILLNIPIQLKAQDFEVSPVKMFFVVDPLESESHILSVKNHSNFKTAFTITFEDFIIDKDGNKQKLTRNSTKNSCTEWITPERTFFDINPNEVFQVNITLQAPEEDYSYRWAMMYVQTAQVQSSFDSDVNFGAGMKLSGRIAIPVYRVPLTRTTPELSIKHLIEEVNVDSVSNERKFSVLVENEGASIAECKVVFIASDLNTAEEIEFDPIMFDSYPGYPREINFTLPETMPPGEYSLVALLDYGKTTTIKGTRLKGNLLIQSKTEDK